ncbi:hypothetical protein D9M68_919450 [compost metagenome]
MTVEHTLADGHEEAPNKDVLLAPGNLDVLCFAFTEGDLPCLVVDIEFKVSVTTEVACDGFVQSQLM